MTQDLAALAAALRTQRQIDMDGCEVAVSRQACDEAADAIEAQAAETARLTARAEKAEAALSESRAREAVSFKAAAPIRSLIEEGEITGLSRMDEFGLYLLDDEQAPVYCALTLTLEQLGKIGSTNPIADAQAALDARINAAKEEGRVLGLREGVECCTTVIDHNLELSIQTGAYRCKEAILSKIKEAENG